jgi:hypothetical protein
MTARSDKSKEECKRLNTEVSNAVQAAGDRAQYDESAKRILSHKRILAHILVKTIDEFKGMNPKDVVKYIEGEPKVGIVPIEPGLTNRAQSAEAGERVVGINTENEEINEGMVRFDIIFYVRMKDGLTQIIVNIEAQRKEPTDYGILNRAIFYVSRMVSSQKGRDFEKSNYDDIKRVVSIWICMNMPEHSMNYYQLTNNVLLGNQVWRGKEDMLSIVMIGLGQELPPEGDEKYELHRLLSALLSKHLARKEKLNIIENEYDIPLEVGTRKELESMCNLSEGIVEDTEGRIITNMFAQHFTLEQIAVATEKTIDEVKEIIENYQPGVV